jgi:hypothetical protein
VYAHVGKWLDVGGCGCVGVVAWVYIVVTACILITRPRYHKRGCLALLQNGYTHTHVPVIVDLITVLRGVHVIIQRLILQVVELHGRVIHD